VGEQRSWSGVAWRRIGTIALALLVAAAWGCEAGTLEPRPPLGHEGRWLVDAHGRVVLLHGVNEVSKSAPFHPSAFGFGADDAAFLAEHGFNAVRLGVDFRGLMPAPGQIDHAYLEALAVSVRDLARERIFVLLDFHQDGFSPKYRGNGLPDWMAMDDGLPNPPVGFPTYYIENRALQRAFESFWANRALPDGVPVQEYYVQGMRAVAERFRHERYVFGYDAMNEPWPGAEFFPCLVACPELEQERLVPFYARATAAVGSVAPRQTVYVEPFVLFNFGTAPTTIPGAGTGNGLSVHSYAVTPQGEQGLLDHALEAAERDDAPLIVTEFGATTDPAPLARLVAGFDAAIVPWMMWAYNESIIRDASLPAGLDNVRNLEALAALVRPYPMAVAGTPLQTAFDPDTGVFDFAYSTTGPSGRRAPPGLTTVVFVPALHYPDGYRVELEGARVVSEPCADRLALRAEPRAEVVTVRVAAGGDCAL
jgi:endoglycosylceramidase